MYSISINKSSINNKMYKSFVEIISSHGKFYHLSAIIVAFFFVANFIVCFSQCPIHQSILRSCQLGARPANKQLVTATRAMTSTRWHSMSMPREVIEITEPDHPGSKTKKMVAASGKKLSLREGRAWTRMAKWLAAALSATAPWNYQYRIEFRTMRKRGMKWASVMAPRTRRTRASEERMRSWASCEAPTHSASRK